MSDLDRVLEGFSLPPEMLDQASIYLQDFVRQSSDQANRIVSSGFGTAFVGVLATSDYFAQTVLRYPTLIDKLLDQFVAEASECQSDSSNSSRQLSLGQDAPIPVSIATVEGDNYEAQLEQLRTQRHLHMLRILWRANGKLCPVETTLVELSELADQLIREAVRLSHAQVAKIFGEPQCESGVDQLCVLAMGKLGGGELNMSSDVDVILTHSESGETSGPRKTSNAEFFARQAKVFADLLTRLTPDGFCYRVDTRLRPFGTSGRPCVNFSAFEHYLAVHGREWERYAYIKQRPLTGSDEQGQEVLGLLRPFVYRKYLDYGVFEELRAMKALIETEIQRKELKDDIKRGPGGIRELEFMVQTLQLVFGGKYPALQTPSFFKALRRLARLNYLSAETAESMYGDYCFLRRVENAVQGLRDQQTHVLPVKLVDQQRLALLMDCDSYAQLLEQLAEVRQRVQSQFDDLKVLGGEATQASMTSTQTFEEVEQNEALSSLRTLGNLRERLEETGRKRLDSLMPRIVDILTSADDAEEIAPRLTTLLSGIGRRSAYFALLLENPAVLDRVVSICRRSPQLASQLALSPVLLDTLVDPRGSSVTLDRAGLATRLQQQVGGIDRSDEEQLLIALREFRKAAIFDVAVADMEQQMPLMNISDRLTDIAELVLGCALEMAAEQLAPRYGRPRSQQGAGAPAQFAIVGYGKLGGLELGYSSDLDLVFLFDDDGDGCTDGEKSVDNSQYFSKLSRRLIQILTVPTRAGTLYEVDMRLRPSGRSGLLVSRLSAFASYQREQAWTWEHQALIRARAVAGNDRLKSRFEALRQDLLQQTRSSETLCAAVRDMRQKMKVELNRSTPTQFDLKQGDGGLVDLEFLVQFLVLAHSHSVPELAVFSDNVRQLDAIEAAKLLPASDAAALREAYISIRENLHSLSLAGQSVLVSQSRLKPEREMIIRQIKAHGLAL
ncbi:MAG: bifunctional [glutamate--ammonia ligase]-adenylyl-L-tyrosine phosphorylase/[glutamate--ammonia-ligase] adenylyltransferase [Gammaproteobacteria bacterium]